jgi:hypothetical protein
LVLLAQAAQVQLAVQVPLAAGGPLETQAFKAPLVHRVLRAFKVQLVQLVRLVIQVHKVFRVIRVFRVPLVRLVPSGIQVHKVLPVLRVYKETLVLQAPQVRKALKEIRV